MPKFGNLGTIYVRDKNGNLVPVPVIQGQDGITPHIGENGNWFIGETDTGIPANNKKYPERVNIYTIVNTHGTEEYTLALTLKDGSKMEVKLPDMGITRDDVVYMGTGEPAELDSIGFKQFYVDKKTGRLYINISDKYPNDMLPVASSVLIGETDPDNGTAAAKGELYINTASGAIFVCVSAINTQAYVKYTWKPAGGTGDGTEEIYVLKVGETLEDVPEGVKVVYELPEEGSEEDGEGGGSNESGGAVIPHIGENGNWFVGDTDTGVKAQGEKGEPGDDYVLTGEDKAEIAGQAAALVDTALLGIIGTGEVTG